MPPISKFFISFSLVIFHRLVKNVNKNDFRYLTQQFDNKV